MLRAVHRQSAEGHTTTKHEERNGMSTPDTGHVLNKHEREVAIAKLSEDYNAALRAEEVAINAMSDASGRVMAARNTLNTARIEHARLNGLGQ